MPFTFSHPAAVLPFLNRSKAGGWKSSLIFGSMSPDLWFGLPFLSQRWVSHGRLGILVDPPLALLLALIFHRWLGPRLCRLPGMESSRPRAPFHWRMAVLGACAGTATHLLWDQFTHTGSRILDQAVFSRKVDILPGVSASIGQLIWFGNSIAGGILILAWIHRNDKGGNGLAAFFSRPWISIAAAFAVPFLILARMLLGEDRSPDLGWGLRVLEMHGGIRLALVLSMLSALLVAMFFTRARRPSDAGD
jgi:hypothetical protein